MILLLLLPALLIVLAARMSMEWLWFAQFHLESVLQQRWGYALISAAAATLVVVCLAWWRRSLDRCEHSNQSSTPWLSGSGYSAALLMCLLALLASTSLVGGLAVLAFVQPFALPHWPEAMRQLSGPSTVLIPVVLSLALAAALRRRWLGWITFWVSLCLIVIVARAWGLWILALKIPDSGFRDAVLNTDSSFALGRFSAWHFALELVLLLLVFHLSAALWLRLTRAPSLSDWSVARFEPTLQRGFERWIAALLAVISALVWLSRYQLLWTRTGVVAGAGWLQDHWLLPLRTGIAALLLVASLALFVRSVHLRSRKIQKLSLVLVGVLLLTELLITPLVGWLWLRPRELVLQTPYIQEAIRSTRHAFQLDQIVRSIKIPSPKLTANDIAEGRSTLDNVRLWDTQPLLQTNSQLQELRVYYRFSGAAVDRYPLLTDQDTAQQVILAPRELDQSELPPRSRSWLNRHFVFTHGYGFTLSPVNTFSNDGLPDYFISDIGSSTRIKGNQDLGISREVVRQEVPVDQGGLYFGTVPATYAVAPTDVDEIDYPEGDVNVYTSYVGSGGIPIGTLPQRLAASIYLAEPRLMFSPSINAETRVMLRRDVRERVEALAPFLQLRGDPYLVSVPLDDSNNAFSSKQHQFWIVEGYTDSITFPYSSAVNSVDTDRYLRNSVKAVVDAYNGTVHLYVSEPDDPLIQGWGNVFPDLLEPLEAMPQQLRDHLRVPEDWFSVQVQQLQRYHVTDPRKFYSSDDVWQVPLETYGRDQVPVRPYHITAQVGSNSASEFLLLQPLTPLARPNLNAWLAARNDNEHYGELLLIDFPRTSPILGPEQVQALINQEPEISKQFGLWDRGGSEVLQGNLLVVPVGDALIYVEPVYLKASQGGLPSLARIVVSDGKEIAMAKTLDVAIAELQQKTPPADKPAE
jgi:uncharacterized membrane protein (UPF0182 family)